jgi:sucrose-6-phosphate hydrolase SacC (GH32 family)
MAPGDNRKVRIGWAQITTLGMPFNQLMYFPTELTLRTTTNGPRLYNVPVAEITNNAVNVYTWTNLSLTPSYNPLSGIRGTLFDVKAQFTVASGTTSQQISCNGVINPLSPINSRVQVEIVVDRDTVEIFGNNGQLYMPLPANNSTGNSLVSLNCTGGTATFNSLTVSKLKSIWP